MGREQYFRQKEPQELSQVCEGDIFIPIPGSPVEYFIQICHYLWTTQPRGL